MSLQLIEVRTNSKAFRIQIKHEAAQVAEVAITNCGSPLSAITQYFFDMIFQPRSS
ncbi:hypothetical protein LguiA_034146 [Lonicera macranthoides]